MCLYFLISDPFGVYIRPDLFLQLVDNGSPDLFQYLTPLLPESSTLSMNCALTNYTHTLTQRHLGKFSIISYGKNNSHVEYRSTDNIPDISLLFIVYFETDMTLDVLRAVMSFPIKEIVVVDGPRKICAPFLDKFNLLYTSENNSPIRSFFYNQVKNEFPNIPIKYHYQIWEDEAEQRHYGYNACKYSIMLTLDGDVLMHLNKEQVYEFAQDPQRAVAGVTLMNMARSHSVFTTNPLNFVPAYRYNVMVKRKMIPPEEFFAHLWIVGTAQKKANASFLFTQNIDTYTQILKGNNNDSSTIQEIHIRRSFETTTCLQEGSNVIIVPRPLHSVYLDEIVHTSKINNLCHHAFEKTNLPFIDDVIVWTALLHTEINKYMVFVQVENAASCTFTLSDSYVNMNRKLQTVASLTFTKNSSTATNTFTRNYHRANFTLLPVLENHALVMRALGSSCKLSSGTLLGHITYSFPN
eukprot:gene2724-5364_t